MDQHQIVASIRRFVEKEVNPVAAALEHDDLYPHDLVLRMRELGLFGALIPAVYGGLGLNTTTYARVIEELGRGWMSLTGVINSHTMTALIVLDHGTEEQRRRLLPRFARGDARGGLCLTEPHAGSDVQAIRTVARRHGDVYLITGTKMFVTNGREGNTFALLARTDPTADPPHKGMSCFIVEKGPPGLQVVKSISKLGYKGVDTAELVFEDLPVPARNLVGGVEGRGFKHVMSGLEMGRINIAARAVGVAQAAFEDALGHVRGRRGRRAPPPAIADMATRLTAARLLTYWAAAMKDRGVRCDLEAGMAKLHASETAQRIAVDAMLIHGKAGTLKALTIERHYRDTPLMIIGEGTNEIQRLVIARQLLQRYGEQPGAITFPEGEPQERKQMLLAVRQFVEKHVIPVVQDYENTSRYPQEIVERLGELGILGAIVPPQYGGLGLDLKTCSMILEELARGWTTVAGIVSPHLALAHAVARFGTAAQHKRLLPPMARGDRIGCAALTTAVSARRARGAWILTGTIRMVESALHGALFVVLGRIDQTRSGCFLVERGAKGLTLSPPLETLGARGLGIHHLRLNRVRVSAASLLGGDRGRGVEQALLATTRRGIAAAAVGVAQAAFEAALRYSQQRSAFGKPICQHQAIQLKLADMATRITAARLLTHADGRDVISAGMAKLHATEAAYEVALEALRIHGGYGYTTEFPVERYYRDVPHLMLALGDPDRERLELVRHLTSPDAGS